MKKKRKKKLSSSKHAIWNAPTAIYTRSHYYIQILLFRSVRKLRRIFSLGHVLLYNMWDLNVISLKLLPWKSIKMVQKWIPSTGRNIFAFFQVPVHRLLTSLHDIFLFKFAFLLCWIQISSQIHADQPLKTWFQGSSYFKTHNSIENSIL